MAAWSFLLVEETSRLHRFEGRLDERAASWGQFALALRDDVDCREALTSTLVQLPFEQIFWETPALTKATAPQPFEFVAIDAGLRMAADVSAFAEHLEREDGPVAVFPNLGRTAVLVVPTEIENIDCAYLLSFLRSAPRTISNAFWAAAGSAIIAATNEKPLWVSTSGGGVAWLHLRLDAVPKYYSHAPYKNSK